ncbi:MAG: DNA-binding protein [Bacteroidetes bacterium]|jgi:AraC family transcriptional regulator|nr:DNA-binding protein [Bacteroidota bacterium]
MENLYYLERVKKVIDYLKSNPSTDISLKKIATIAMFSEFHFHRIFKEATGETLRQYIKRLRMEKAGICLENDDSIAIKELWSQLGYCTASHFSKDFRHFYGCSPSQYQKQRRANKMRKSRSKATVVRIRSSRIVNKKIPD